MRVIEWRGEKGDEGLMHTGEGRRYTMFVQDTVEDGKYRALLCCCCHHPAAPAL